jgi:hypothetical protein
VYLPWFGVNRSSQVTTRSGKLSKCRRSLSSALSSMRARTLTKNLSEAVNVSGVWISHIFWALSGVVKCRKTRNRNSGTREGTSSCCLTVVNHRRRCKLSCAFLINGPPAISRDDRKSTVSFLLISSLSRGDGGAAFSAIMQCLQTTKHYERHHSQRMLLRDTKMMMNGWMLQQTYLSG